MFTCTRCSYLYTRFWRIKDVYIHEMFQYTRCSHYEMFTCTRCSHVRGVRMYEMFLHSRCSIVHTTTTDDVKPSLHITYFSPFHVTKVYAFTFILKIHFSVRITEWSPSWVKIESVSCVTYSYKKVTNHHSYLRCRSTQVALTLHSLCYRIYLY